MRRILGLVIGAFLVVNGILILVEDNCSSVSFSGQDGKRVLAGLCRSDNSGLLSSAVAGFGMIGVGILIGFLFLGRSKKIVAP